MNDEEIHSLARIILPGIKTNSMTRIGHFFTIIEDADGFGVLTTTDDREKCNCCHQSTRQYTYSKTPLSADMNKTTSSTGKPLEGSNLTTNTNNALRKKTKSDQNLRANEVQLRILNDPTLISQQPQPTNNKVLIRIGTTTDGTKKQVVEEEGNCLKQCWTECGQCCIGILRGI
ncbi:unnamed protein product [Dracunculus medinensis]|uniref:Uncharacterized protein n=1 Tax=Dracunculus medinensis TaxID=318479 RepID=A0A0N4UG08_DRAME|nr:unnamed protein product [Dracunculus medinensis]